VFCREDGTPLDRWHVRKEFQKITKAGRLGGEWTPRELRHSFVSILSAHDVRLEDISDLVGHSSTAVTRDGLPARDPARAHQGRDRHEPDSQGQASYMRGQHLGRQRQEIGGLVPNALAPAAADRRHPAASFVTRIVKPDRVHIGAGSEQRKLARA